MLFLKVARGDFTRTCWFRVPTWLKHARSRRILSRGPARAASIPDHLITVAEAALGHLTPEQQHCWQGLSVAGHAADDVLSAPLVAYCVSAAHRRGLFQSGQLTYVPGPGLSQQAAAHRLDATAVNVNISSNSGVAGSAPSTTSTPSSSRSSAEHAVTAALAASMALSAVLAAAPMTAVSSASAAEAPEVQLQQGSAPPLHPSGVAALPMPEAPALVSDSSEVLLGSMREAVAGSLQEMAASSMTAVGGPVVGEALSAGLASSSSNSSSSDATSSGSVSSPAAALTGAATNLEQASAAVSPAAENAATLTLGHRALLCGLWQRYCHALETSPLLTKVYTGVVGTMLGDLAAQLLSYSQCSTAANSYSSRGPSRSSSRRGSISLSRSNSTTAKPGFKFDVLRCGRLCLYSAAIGTPMGHYWYEVLEALVMPGSPTAPAAVAAKVALDQLLQTPFGMALFFSVMKVMEGRPGEVPQELRSKLMPALLANWKLWPAAQLVNFTVIPPEQRILFGNIVGVCWTCVISNMQQSSNVAAGVAEAGSSGKVVTDVGAAGSSEAEAGAGDARKLRRPSTPVPA